MELEGIAGSPRYGVQAFGRSGPEGPVLWVPEIDYEHRIVSILGRKYYELVPFAPGLKWAVAPQGVVAGASDQYRFMLRRDDGTTLVVHRYWEPAPVHEGQAEWERSWRVAWVRALVFDWTWNGGEVPLHQPAFEALIPTASGEVWVARRGMSHRVDDCLEDPSEDVNLALSKPCWRAEEIFDVFGGDGRYLGNVEIPPGFHLSPWNLFIRGNLVLTVAEDEAGTIMVKRYRLVLPAER